MKKREFTSFASFSRRRGLLRPSSGISSKATVIDESYSTEKVFRSKDQLIGMCCTIYYFTDVIVPLFCKQHPARGEETPHQICLVSKPQHHVYQTGRQKKCEARERMKRIENQKMSKANEVLTVLSLDPNIWDQLAYDIMKNILRA